MEEESRMIAFRDARDVSQDFGRFLDGVIHAGPAFVKRDQDEFAVLSTEHLDLLLTPFRSTLEYEEEADGSLSGGLQEIDLVGNAASLAALKGVLAQDVVDYAWEYLANFALYYGAPNRRGHLPYVLRALLQQDSDAVAALIDT